MTLLINRHCWFDTGRYGWWRYGTFFPYELWGDGPFPISTKEKEEDAFAPYGRNADGSAQGLE